MRGIPEVSWKVLVVASLVGLAPIGVGGAFAQMDDATATAQTENTSSPLTEDELEVLVARIALYPDSLVALITTASQFGVQIVDAARFLDKSKSDSSLKPKASWDSSVISLLNYPEIVKMMSDDLDWTEQLGDTVAAQQDDVLNAIQQLREEAEAKGIIKSDDKIKVDYEDDSIVIQSASTEKIYVPKYEPAMLYEPDYVAAPVNYYPDPYPYYYYPTAPYFPGFVTGVAWAAAVDWAHGGIWDGPWRGNNFHVDCNHCFNNINGRVNWNDVDWRHVDRSKLRFDHNQFNNVDRKNFRKNIEANKQNRVGNRNTVANHSGNRNRVSVNDVRAAKNSGNKVKINNNINVDNSKRINAKNTNNRVNNAHDKRANVDRSRHNNVNRQTAEVRKQHNKIDNRHANVNRNVARQKPGQFHETRRHSPYGDMNSGRRSQMHSVHGRNAMAGRHFSGGRRHVGRR